MIDKGVSSQLLTNREVQIYAEGRAEGSAQPPLSTESPSMPCLDNHPRQGSQDHPMLH